MKHISRFLKVKISDPVGVMWIWSLPCALLMVLAWVELAAGHNHLIGPDFLNFWTGARLAIEGKISSLYSIEGFRAAARQTSAGDNFARVFSYPPNILPLIAVFGLLPYGPALALWSLAGSICLVAALRANRFSKPGASALTLAALSPAAIFSLTSGQNGAFTAALFLGGFYLSESAPLTAGVLFGLLTVKPQLGILIPLALLLRRNWKCIASAAATALALAAVTYLLWGTTPWRDYAAVIIPFQASLVDPAALLSRGPGNAYDVLMPAPYVDFAMIPGIGCPWIPYGAAALFALYVSLAAVRRDGVSARSVAILALATLIVTPYNFTYDMVMVMGALVVYLATLAEVALPVHLAFGLLWAMPAGLFMLRHAPLPFSTAIMLAALTCLHLATVRKKS